jgi:hypothetical protein
MPFCHVGDAAFAMVLAYSVEVTSSLTHISLQI